MLSLNYVATKCSINFCALNCVRMELNEPRLNPRAGRFSMHDSSRSGWGLFDNSELCSSILSDQNNRGKQLETVLRQPIQMLLQSKRNSFNKYLLFL